jgi:NhaA family Na+:H+ antiporter
MSFVGLESPPSGVPTPLLHPSRPPSLLRRWLRSPVSAGVLLMASTLVALLVANGPWAEAWSRLWAIPVGPAIGPAGLRLSLAEWVNDGLMAVFFLLVGLEIKREIVAGELSDPRSLALPVATAFGGAMVPALIYFALRHGTPQARGWAIPTATDIAFVVGMLALLGPRVPRGLRLLMLTLAVVDDLIAVVVIALFYGHGLAVSWGLLAFAGVVLVAGMARRRVSFVPAYLLAGGVVWIATLKSGIHPTVAGAVLGLATPARPSARRGEPSPAERVEHALKPWVAFGIMPVFALSNAGVAFAGTDPGSPGSIAVAAGLLLGKPVGFLLAAYLVVRTGLARLPAGVTWRTMLGAGCLAGIGFTMSIFVATLAFSGRALLEAKTGVFLGSLSSAILGMLLLVRFLPRRAPVT